jgi:hypothetical protein
MAMTKAAQKVKDAREVNPLFFVGEGLSCICKNCGGGPKKKAPFYKVWNDQLFCSVCKKGRF